MSEIWKDIPQFSDYYQASNKGRVRSKDRMVIRTRNGIKHSYFRPGRILKSHIEGSGYSQTLITFPGFKKHLKMHRLVAFAWIDNPLNKRCINHKNGIKTDNRVENLEWNTHGENLIHAHATGLKRPSQLGRFGALHTRSKPVLSINQTALIEHESRRLCAKYLGVDPNAVNVAIKKGYTCVGHKLYAL